MIRLKLFAATIIMFVLNVNSFAQTIIDPVYVPYFIIKRKTASIRLPENLGGKDTKGFAGITIFVDNLGKLQNTKIEKLHLSGKFNISYQLGQDVKNDNISKYETFLKKCVSKIKIIKTDKRKAPAISSITFLVRF